LGFPENVFAVGYSGIWFEVIVLVVEVQLQLTVDWMLTLVLSAS
jgi:hypothetical protein